MTSPGPFISTEARDALEDRAADFLQRRRFWDWSDEDEAELSVWLAQSASHQAAYLRLEAGAERIERLAALGPSSSDGQSAGPRGFANRKFLIPFLAAASIACLAAIGIPIALHFMQPPVRIFATDVGERGQIKFADRTEVQLNTDTVVRYRMTTRERAVWLEKGEAFFRVTHDADHPFTVYADGHRITDLGTEFLVRESAGRLSVALFKGRAQLSTDDKGLQVATLAPGDEATATSTIVKVTKKTKAELDDELAWQRGVIVFRGTPLSEAVREFNRYVRTKLVIADPSIAGLRMGGEFRTDNVESFLVLVQDVFKVRVARTANEILLSGGGQAAKDRAPGASAQGR